MIDNDDDQDQNITYGTLIDQSIDDDDNVMGNYHSCFRLVEGCLCQ